MTEYNQKSIEVNNPADDLKAKLPSLDCGDCRSESCNEFIQAVINGKAKEDQGPQINKKAKKTIEGELFHEIEEMGKEKYVHIGFRDEENKFGDMLAEIVPKAGMTKKARITIELI